jgi:hypothetical protein
MRDSNSRGFAGLAHANLERTDGANAIEKDGGVADREKRMVDSTGSERSLGRATALLLRS